MSLQERAYSVLVRLLLPSSFRRDFAVHLQRAFRDQLRDHRGAGARAHLWASTSFDLLRTASRLRRDRRQRFSLPTRERRPMSGIVQDLRYAARNLGHAPTFTVIAALTLALGIGANALIFSLVDGVLLRPLPLPDADRLVNVWESNPERGWPRFTVSPLNFLDWKEQATSYTALTAIETSSMTLTGDGGEPERLLAALVADDFFTTIGREPSPGRSFRPEEHATGAGYVVVLGPGVWSRRFGADPGVVGRKITLDGNAFEVVGVVTDPLAAVPATADLWIPNDLEDARTVSRGAHYWRVIGRLAPGVELSTADAEMRAIAARLPLDESGWTATVSPLQADLVSPVRSSLWLLGVAVGLVLLIACANVANLLLVRAESRSRELSLRAALGAGRWRLARQVLLESGLLAGAGVLLALPIAYVGLEWLRNGAAFDMPRLREVAIDARVLGFAAFTGMLTALLFGLAPAARAARLDPAANLKEGERGAQGKRAVRLRSILVVAEVGMAVTIVLTAGLLARSLWKLQSVDPGFETDSRLTARLSLPQSRYATPEERIGFYDTLLASLRGAPGVLQAASASNVPMDGDFSISFAEEGDDPAPGASAKSAETRIVDSEYFAVLGIDLVAGRLFGPDDLLEAEGAVVVNEAFVRTYFPDRSPLGVLLNIGYAQISPEEGGPRMRRIVGVVRDMRDFGLGSPAPATYYLSRQQDPMRTMNVVLQGSAEAGDLVPILRARLAEIDPLMPLFNISSLDDVVRGTTGLRRFRLGLVASFAMLALLLAALGIYGTVAFGVSRRTHEIGVRMAIGARPADVLRLVLRGGLVPVLIGIVVGLGGAAALGGALSSMLYEITPFDVTTHVAVVLVLLAVAIAACWLPARRAMRVQPVNALRFE